MKKLLKVLLVAAGIFLGLVVLLLGAAAVIIPMKFPPEKLKSMAVDAASKALNRKVSVGSVGFNVLKGFQITDLKIPNREGWTPGNILSAKEIAVSYQLLPLLWGKVALGEIRLDHPKILVENRGKAGFNFSDMTGKTVPAQTAPKLGTPPPASKKASGKAPALTVDSINILNAKLTYIDASGRGVDRTDLDDLTLRVKNISLEGGKTTLSLTSPFNYQKKRYDVELNGALRYDLPAQSLKDLFIKGDVSGVGFQFEGSAKDLADNFSPDIKGTASLEVLKTIGLLPRSLASMPSGLELRGPAVLSFSLGGSLNEGLTLDAKAEGEGMYIRYKDLFLKEAKMPMNIQFQSTYSNGKFFKVNSYRALFRDWEAQGAFSYINGDSYAFSLKTKSLPIAGLSETIPRWKDIKFGGSLALDASGGQKLGNDKSFWLKGRYGLKGISVSHPKESHFLEGLNCGIDMTQGTFRVTDFSANLLGTQAKLTLAADGFSLLGSWDLDKLNAHVTGSLSTTSDLDLERFMKVFLPAGEKKPLTEAEQKAAEKKEMAEYKAAKDSSWAVGPGMTADLKMNFKSFTYRKLKFENVAFTGALAKRLLQSRASIAGFGGAGSGALNMSLAGIPGYSFVLALRGVSAERTINDFVDSLDDPSWKSWKDKYYGTMDFDFKGTARGTAKATLDASLLGSGAATLTGAKVKGYAAIKTLNGLFKDKSDEIKFDIIKATLSVKDRVLSFAANTLGKVGTMRAQGGLNIVSWNYQPDMKIQCDVQKKFLDSDAVKKVLPGGVSFDLVGDAKGNVPVDIKFTGKASENHYSWDWGRLTKNLGNNLLKDLFKKPAPAGTPAPAVGATPAPAAGATPAQAKPKKQPKAEDLLKGLFNKK